MAGSENEFDVVLIGTGLTQSIAAAALSKAGIKVAHIDPNPYYGADNASLTLDELVAWADRQSESSDKYFSISKSTSTPPDARRYSISLTPAVIPSIGPHITTLVASGVARYGGFKLVQPISVCASSGSLQNVPGSKEDIFKNSEISLIDKRRLMRFLMFAASDFEDKPELKDTEDMPFRQFLESVFSLNSEMSSIICFALAYCATLSDPTKSALTRIRRCLRSHGRYGPSSFIIGQYGGAGEIAQGFCRTSAVHGGVYILGRHINSVTYKQPSSSASTAGTDQPTPYLYTIELDDFPEPLMSRILVASAEHSLPLQQATPATAPDYGADPVYAFARCIAIIDRPIIFPNPLHSRETSDTVDDESLEPESGTAARRTIDAAAIVYPPSSIVGSSDSAAATVIIMGDGTMSTPKDRWLVYIMLPLGAEPSLSTEAILQPYLDHLLALTSPVPTSTESAGVKSESPLLFNLFYTERVAPSAPTSHEEAASDDVANPFVVVPSPTPHPTEFFDSATTDAEDVFWRVIKLLQTPHPSRWRSPDDSNIGNVESPILDIDSFWPPLERDDDDDDEEW